MANSFKYLSDNDKTVTTNVLVEPVATTKPETDFTGPVGSPAGTGWYEDVHEPRYFKKFASGSDSVGYQTADKIFDITYGISSDAKGTLPAMSSVEKNIYNQYSKILLGYNTGSTPNKFDLDTEDATGKGIMHFAYFINFSRSFFKDKIKPTSFNMKVHVGPNAGAIDTWGDTYTINIVDSGSNGRYDVRPSRTGNVGKLYYSRESTATSISNDSDRLAYPVGLVFYEAGVAVLTPAIFGKYDSAISPLTSSLELNQNVLGVLSGSVTAQNISGSSENTIQVLASTKDIENLADGLAKATLTSSYYAETEINSSIYFCRAFNHEFNYSSNPTYLNNSKIVVKGDDPEKQSVAYITTVGLYSDDNQLLAVAKLSEPIKKTPDNELIARVRIDY